MRHAPRSSGHAGRRDHRRVSKRGTEVPDAILSAPAFFLYTGFGAMAATPNLVFGLSSRAAFTCLERNWLQNPVKTIFSRSSKKKQPGLYLAGLLGYRLLRAAQ